MQSIIAQGDLGKSIRWTLYENGRFEAAGAGAMVETCCAQATLRDGKRDIVYTALLETLHMQQKVREAVFGEGITTVGERLFAGCINLASVTLPRSLTVIEPAAFFGCRALTAVDIPDGVTAICAQAFCQCAALACVRFGESGALREIGYQAFRGCALADFTVPASVERIGEGAFKGCRCARVSAGVAYLGSWCLGYADIARTVSPVMLREGTTGVADGAFRGYMTKAVILPASIRYIGASAFAGCKYLKDVQTPQSGVKAGPFAFEGTAWESR